MRLKELRERCGELLQKMKVLRDGVEERRNQGKRGKELWSDSQRREWEQLLKDYDETRAKIDLLKGEAPDLEAMVRSMEDATYIPGHARSARELAREQGRRADDTAMRFRDVEKGREIRAVLPSERLQDRRPSENARDLSLGNVLHFYLTGRGDLLNDSESRAVAQMPGSQGGFLLSTPVSELFLDLARSASVVTKAGAQTITMDDASMRIAKLNTDPTANWKHELASMSESSPVFGAYNVKPVALTMAIPVSVEILEDAPNVGRILEDAIRRVFGLKLDQAALIGSGLAPEPLGVQNNPDIQTVTGVGTPTDYSEVSSAVQKILTANFPEEELDRLAWIRHPRDGATYDGLVDTTGQPLQPTPWAETLMKMSTTSIPTTLGGGGNESIGFVGDFRQVLLVMRTQIQIRIASDGHITDTNATKDLAKFIIAFMRADVVHLRPTWHALLSGITA